MQAAEKLKQVETGTTATKRPVSKIMIPHQDILGIEQLNADEISSILDLAEYYVVQNRRKSQTNALLKGLVLVNLFLENSTRTRLSFEMAAKRLGLNIERRKLRTDLFSPPVPVGGQMKLALV